MKRTLVVTVAGWLLASYGAAQNRPKAFQYNLTVSVKPGMTDAYESYVRKIVEAATKLGKSQNGWGGRDRRRTGRQPSISSLLLLDSWQEKDNWMSVPQMLREAFGEEGAARISLAGEAAVASSSSDVLQFRSGSASGWCRPCRRRWFGAPG